MTEWIYNFADDTVAIDSLTLAQDTVQLYRGIFTRDTAVSPRTIDIRLLWSLNQQYAGKTIQSLYSITGGNTLEIAENNPGAARPLSLNPDSASVLSLILQQ